MARHLDLTALRSFAATADAGGVTRAAAQLNLTQSAVSMQLKRLEESLGLALFDRSGRTMALTAPGEQLLGYARRLLALNDEAWGRMTDQAFEGELMLGVPQDIMYPNIPRVLRQFARVSAGEGAADLGLRRRSAPPLRAPRDRHDPDHRGGGRPGGETLVREPLVWVGAQGGKAWRSRPLRFGSTARCVFRRTALEALERAGVPWELAVEFGLLLGGRGQRRRRPRGLRAARTSVPARCELIRHGGALPELPDY